MPKVLALTLLALLILIACSDPATTAVVPPAETQLPEATSTPGAEEKKASPDSIRAFTFTRAAAKELEQRVRSDFGTEKTPRISTLHSFAL